jgi:hypothetical protein
LLLLEVFWFYEVCVYVSVGVCSFDMNCPAADAEQERTIANERYTGILMKYTSELAALYIFPQYVLSDEECCIIRMFILPDTAWSWSKSHFSVIVLRYSVIGFGEVVFGTLAFPSICLTKCVGIDHLSNPRYVTIIS